MVDMRTCIILTHDATTFLVETWDLIKKRNHSLPTFYATAQAWSADRYKYKKFKYLYNFNQSIYVQVASQNCKLDTKQRIQSARVGCPILF